jgi:hypothetical protein
MIDAATQPSILASPISGFSRALAADNACGNAQKVRLDEFASIKKERLMGNDGKKW